MKTTTITVTNNNNNNNNNSMGMQGFGLPEERYSSHEVSFVITLSVPMMSIVSSHRILSIPEPET